MPRERSTSERLRAACDHLFYEVWMLEDLPRCLALELAQELSAQNALLESFTIHARALLAFLYPPDNPRKSDVLAEDFFDDPEEWNRLRPPKAAVLDQVNTRVGREIAHLTYNRQEGTPEAKKWPIPEIARAIHSVVRLFLQTVPRDRLGGRWESPPSAVGMLAGASEIDVSSAGRTCTSNSPSPAPTYSPPAMGYPSSVAVTP